MANIEVDVKLCDGCGSCIEACPMDVLAIDKDKAKPIRLDLCMSCGLCEVKCPQEAIKIFD